MKEVVQILAAFDELSAAGKPAALGTVVAVAGSAYRRPGARMLIAEDGRTWGGVSGGCLERDVVRRGRGVIASGKPVVARYDTTDEDDLDAGVALGCRGIVDIFIEPLSVDSPGPLPALGSVLGNRKSLTMVSVLHSSGGSRLTPGMRIVEGCDSASPELQAVLADSLQAEPSTRPTVRRIFCDRAEVTIFTEVLRPPQSLVIFGGGADIVPLVEIAKAVGWHITVVVARPATGMRERFGAADVVLVGSADIPDAGVALERGAAVVLATHNYPRDAQILAGLTRQPISYLGLLGPRYRARRLIAHWPAGICRDHVYAPIGLDLGADTPEEIALAVVAEIKAVLAQQPAGFLRDRLGSVHTRPSGATVALPEAASPYVAGERTCAISA